MRRAQLAEWYLGAETGREDGQDSESAPQRHPFHFHGLDVNPAEAPLLKVYHASSPATRSINLEMLPVGQDTNNPYEYDGTRSSGYTGSGVYVYTSYEPIRRGDQPNADVIYINPGTFFKIRSTDHLVALENAARNHLRHIKWKLFPPITTEGRREAREAPTLEKVVEAYENVFGQSPRLSQAVYDAVAMYVKQRRRRTAMLLSMPQTIVMKALGYRGVMFDPNSNDVAHMNNDQRHGAVVFLNTNKISTPPYGGGRVSFVSSVPDDIVEID